MVDKPEEVIEPESTSVIPDWYDYPPDVEDEDRGCPWDINDGIDTEYVGPERRRYSD